MFQVDECVVGNTLRSKVLEPTESKTCTSCATKGADALVRPEEKPVCMTKVPAAMVYVRTVSPASAQIVGRMKLKMIKQINRGVSYGRQPFRTDYCENLLLITATTRKRKRIAPKEPDATGREKGAEPVSTGVRRGQESWTARDGEKRSAVRCGAISGREFCAIFSQGEPSPDGRWGRCGKGQTRKGCGALGTTRRPGGAARLGVAVRATRVHTPVLPYETGQPTAWSRKARTASAYQPLTQRLYRWLHRRAQPGWPPQAQTRNFGSPNCTVSPQAGGGGGGGGG